VVLAMFRLHSRGEGRDTPHGGLERLGACGSSSFRSCRSRYAIERTALHAGNSELQFAISDALSARYNLSESHAVT
jgi:hypothetical protein